MSSKEAHNPESTVGCYRLIRTLGSGSFGVVRLGEHKETGTPVAVKIMEKVRRADDEAKTVISAADARLTSSEAQAKSVIEATYGQAHATQKTSLMPKPGPNVDVEPQGYCSEGVRLNLGSHVESARSVLHHGHELDCGPGAGLVADLLPDCLTA